MWMASRTVADPYWEAPSQTADSPLSITPTDSDDSGQRGANYFFGFLITFVVLLLVFVGCGIGSRRRYLLRRAGELNGSDHWGAGALDGDGKRPVVFEHAYTPAAGLEWKNIMPLTATSLTHQQQIADQKYESDAAALAAARTQGTAIITTLADPTSTVSSATTSTRSSWLPQRFKHESLPCEVEPGDADTNEVIRVAIMIAMPSTPSSSRPSSIPLSHLPEYQLGVETLPWKNYS